MRNEQARRTRTLRATCTFCSPNVPTPTHFPASPERPLPVRGLASRSPNRTTRLASPSFSLLVGSKSLGPAFYGIQSSGWSQRFPSAQALTATDSHRKYVTKLPWVPQAIAITLDDGSCSPRAASFHHNWLGLELLFPLYIVHPLRRGWPAAFWEL